MHLDVFENSEVCIDARQRVAVWKRIANYKKVCQVAGRGK